ncbi:phenylalanine--tRNA ligase subunit beta [Nitrosophilus alvini]|uniref:phenylalanine--tRNA ligase subunit beta n=1 Tax=Nitrosophilus alvini TaxID=2714855 RepID=UPI00190C1D61|nr:phenylalanine--tRNA ligase subunit beta [Nitrosophilus alvini]
MIVTRSWLNEWIDLGKIETEKLLETLNKIGLEVAEYKKIDIPEKVVIGKVLECKKHPDADKLSVCQVDIGSAVRQIVCGAKNIKEGQFVPVATIGALLPGNFKIKHAKLRGVESDGMICSSTEIGLPKIEEGILVLDESIGRLEIGRELREYPILNDEIIEIELTANRGDCLSICGIARELSAAFDLPVKSFEEEFLQKGELQIGIGRVLHMKHENNIDASLMYKVYSNDVESLPLKIKARLSIIEESFKSPIEDFAFYATYSTGVILRSYCYEIFKKDEKSAQIEIKRDEMGFTSVYDSKKVSMVGVNQIEESKPLKKDEYFIIEASYIDPETVSKKVFEAKEKVETDWVYYRSSRGSEPNLAFGLDYLCSLFKKYTALKIFAGTHEIITEVSPKIININLENLNSLIGQEIDKNRIVKILQKLQFEVTKAENDNLVVKIPLFRHDIENEQDIAEEIVRLVGIDNIEAKPFKLEEKNRINDAYKEFKKRKELRQRAVAAGFYETVNYVFTNRDILKKYGFETIKPEKELINPITNELNTLRTTLATGLLEQARNNMNFGKKSVRLFETGTVFDSDRNEKIFLSFIFSGFKENDSVSNLGKPEFIDFATFANRISSIIGDFELIETKPDNLLAHPYQCAKVVVDSDEVGVIYKLHLSIQKELELPPTYICELFFDKIPFELKEAKKYSKFQPSFKDLSVVIDKNITFKEVKEAIKEELPEEVRRFYPIDIYESEELGEKKSLTVRFLIQSDEKTLEESEISEILEKILDKLKAKIGAELR